MLTRISFLWLCTFISFLPVCLSVPPKFIGELKNVTVTQGRDATFTCSVTHLGGYKVAWIKSDSKAILAIHDHVITNNHRLQVTHNDKDTWTLTIKDVKQKDSGQYMCQVNADPMVTQVANLEVVIPPEISDKHSTTDMNINEGSQAKFVCSATGHPIPQITWRKQVRHEHDRAKIRLKDKSGRDVLEATVSGEVLSLPPVSREDMGNYMCIAQNGVPPAISKSYKLIVNFQPQITVSNNLVGAPPGTHIIFRCQIEASPKPITYWRRKGSEDMLVPGSKYNISENSIGDYKFVTTLHIAHLNSQDFYEYQCVTKNTIGMSEETIELYELQRDFDSTTLAMKTYQFLEAEYETVPPKSGAETTSRSYYYADQRAGDEATRKSDEGRRTGNVNGFFGGISSSGNTLNFNFSRNACLLTTSMLFYILFSKFLFNTALFCSVDRTYFC